jgi:hypothetical protein
MCGGEDMPVSSAGLRGVPNVQIASVHQDRSLAAPAQAALVLRKEIAMYSKKCLVLFAAAIVLVAGSLVARAGNDSPDDRDSGLNEHQTELDEQYARSQATVMPATPARASTPYGYVPPHRPTAKHRHRINR